MPFISNFSDTFKPLGDSFGALIKSSFETGPFTFDFDYMVVEYFFNDGNDMDTMTYISNPAIMNNDFGSGLPGDYVGTCAFAGAPSQFPNNGPTPYLIYGGDNTGIGTEAILFDLNEYKNQRPSDTDVELTFTSTWYGTTGSTPVIMRSTMWKGGTPIQDGYTFINSTATATKMIESDGTIITSNTQNCEEFQQVAKFEFNIQSHNGYFSNPNQIVPTLTPTPTPTFTPTPTSTPTPTPTSASNGEFVYTAQTGIGWNGYGGNYLSFGLSQDGLNKTPLAGWYFKDSNNVVRRLLNNVLWFSSGNPSPYRNGNGWMAVANGSFYIDPAQTTITFYETSPV